MMTDALTPKQLRFIEEYLIDANATQAAVRAGYSTRTANQQGPRLLENPVVLAAIDAAKIDRSEKLKIDAEWILQRLVDEAEADLADLYDDKGDLKPVEQWPEIWRKGLVTGIDVEVLFDGFGNDRRQIGTVKKIKLSDRVRRLELIGKHIKVNAFQESVHHTGLDALGERLDRAMAQINRDSARQPQAVSKPQPSRPVTPPAECTAPAAPPPEPPAPVAPPPKPYRPIMPDPAPVSWPTTIAHAATDYDPDDI